jgi:hypothetical protein
LDYSKVTLGRDRIDKDSNPLFTAGTGNEHGTFSWGLVSAIQGNDKGIDGYNDKANVYLSRAIGSGEWDLALTDFVGEAKAQNQKNAIALLPLDLTQKNADGSITTRYEFTNRERAALENARQNGVLLVVAAGNDGGVMSVLGQSSQEFENILTVGSSDGFGRSDYSSYGYGLDILVPGGAIDNPTLSTVGDDIGTMSGTSASAAIAAGMASKVWESNPDLNATQVIDVLTGSAIDLKEPGWDEETGFGVVNFNKAVQVAKETAPQAYIPTPFSNPTTWGLEGLVTPLERATADQFNGKYYDWESYTIQDGDTLSQIAIDTMGDSSPDFYNFIAQHNNIPNPDEIYAGQEIQIPKEVSAPQQQPPTNDNPNVDFNPPTNDNPNVDFNPDNPNVDFNPDDNPNVDFNPDYNLNVDFNPDNPNVDFNPDYNPNVGFNPDNPNVDFNPDDNPNVDFNPPQSNSINLNGYTIGNNFYAVFQNYQGTLGNPTSDVINYNGVSYQLFENGSIVSSANGTFPLYGGIRQTYRNTGGLEGWLGAPTSEEKGLGDGNIIQYFENGHIYWNGSKATAYKEGTGLPSIVVPPNQPLSGNIGGSHSGGGFTLVSSDGTQFNSIKEYLLYLRSAGLLTDTVIKTYAHYDGFVFFWNDQRWEETINEAKDLAYINGNPSSDIGKLYKDLNTDLFGVDKPFPISGAYISNEYHQEVLSETGIDYGYHGGIDILARRDGKGVEVKSLVDGTVVLAGRDENGNPINGDKLGYLTIRDDATGTNHIYMHLSKITVKEGNHVTAGEPVGVTGATGVNNIHLHYEVGRPGTDPKGEVIKRILKPEDKAKQRLREVTYNPLENYWEMKYYGPNGKPAPTYI